MNPNKPTEEILYDIVTDLYRAVHGQPSIAKMEQLKRVGINFSVALDKTTEKSCIDVFERLQKRVHSAFTAMESDMKKIEEKVDEKLVATDARNKSIEIQLESVKEIANKVRAEIKALDNLFKGIGQ